MGKLQKKINSDFTVVHNDFLRDNRLGIDERGLLMTMLSLPDNWNFSIAGLASKEMLPDGKHKIMNALNKLKELGYFRRTRLTDKKTGRVIDWVYEFSDEPNPEWLEAEQPHSDLPHLDEPHLDNEPQSNTNISNTKINNIDMIDDSCVQKKSEADAVYKETIAVVSEQISSDILVGEFQCSNAVVDEVTAILTDIYLSDAPNIKINGSTMPMSIVQERLQMLTYFEVKYVIESLHRVKKDVKNMRAYLITSLYNSTMTLNAHIENVLYSNNIIR